MKYMVTWKIPTGTYNAAVETFLKTGAPVPEGVTSVARWHALGSAYGWHVVEGDAEPVAQAVAEWAGVCELEVTPVVDDQGAANSLSKVFGK